MTCKGKLKQTKEEEGNYITLTSFQTPLTPKVTSGASTNTYMLYEIKPTGPACRLATPKVGYDQQRKLKNPACS